MKLNRGGGEGDGIHTPRDLGTNSWSRFGLGMGLVGWTKMAVRVGRENGEQERKKRGGRMEEEGGGC
jgi:hypothetical protein